MRGSLRAPIDSDSTSRTASFTRRMRSELIRCHHLPLDARELEALRGEVALGAVEEADELDVLPGDARDREPGPLPDVVVVDLGHGGSEAPLQLRLDGEKLLPLPLQRVVVREVELRGEDPDVAGAHRPATRSRPPPTRRGRR